jgi:hypothetical protein
MNREDIEISKVMVASFNVLCFKLLVILDKARDLSTVTRDTAGLRLRSED